MIKRVRLQRAGAKGAKPVRDLSAAGGKPGDTLRVATARWWQTSERELKRFRAAKAKLSARYLTSRRAVTAYRDAVGVSPVPEVNVVGVGIGERRVDGRLTGATSLKLYVRHKYSKHHIDPGHLLPTSFAGLPVDVEEIGKVRPLLDVPDPRVTRTPAQPGCSIGFEYPDSSQRMAGTFGAVVRDQGGALYALSNSHVLAYEGRLPVGSPIFQCGLLDLDSGSQKRPIAKLTRFTDLNAKNLRVDAAIAGLSSPDIASPEILAIGKPTGTTSAQNQMLVHKVGRTTAYTVGWVLNVDTDITLDYDTGSYTFFNQIVVASMDDTPFCDTGDSGSLVLERSSGKAIGLLCAASHSHAIVNHIQDVLNSLQVSLA